MQVREYRQQDFDELWRLDQECFPPALAYSRAELMHYIRHRGTQTLVAENDAGSISGFAVAQSLPMRGQTEDRGRVLVGHIITLDVRKHARRRGIGDLLMNAAEAWLSHAGCEVVYLETAVDNHTAIAFYKKHGYGVLRTAPRYYNGKLDALVMGKRMSRSSAPVDG
jgi:ribosomal protein S18 acetylase RimI-like enzyme